ncbi:NADH-quinone oxidoreductase subunit K [bacterium HR08]|nr:NADH-quinone oxidoreductase subunit K [bacterium HR08]GBC81129.1 NADH-quinone oxidoreductase subunit K [bacterium HR10]
MTTIPISWYLAVAAVLFTIGTVTVFVKRNAIVMLLGIELMLNAANLTLVTFSSYFRELAGQIMVFFVMVVAAAEAAVGLAIVVLLFRHRETLNVDEAQLLKL